MSESDEQSAVVDYCDLKGIPCYHIPNGGLRSKREAARMKGQGVRPGVPDLCIPVARRGYHSLYIEMKAAEGGRAPHGARGVKLVGLGKRRAPGAVALTRSVAGRGMPPSLFC